MENRRAKREKKRATCELWIEGRRNAAIVLDVSATGLFVQTNATTVTPNSVVEVRIPSKDEGTETRIRARVARVKRMPPELAVMGGGGLGLQILERVVVPAGDGAAPVTRAAPVPRRAEPPPSAPKKRFRVQLAQATGSRSRSVDVEGDSEDDARRVAIALAGTGWLARSVRALGAACAALLPLVA